MYNDLNKKQFYDRFLKIEADLYLLLYLCLREAGERWWKVVTRR